MKHLNNVRIKIAISLSALLFTSSAQASGSALTQSLENLEISKFDMARYMFAIKMYTSSYDFTDVKPVSEEPSTDEELIIIQALTELEKAGQLGKAINELFARPNVKEKIKDMPPQQVAMIKLKFEVLLRSQLQLLGAVGESNYVPWQEVSKENLRWAKDFLKRLKPTGESYFKSKNLKSEFLNAFGSNIYDAQEVKILVNGPESFAKRDQLIKDAKKSIFVNVWSIYDDFTGDKYTNLFIKKQKEGIEVKVIVDGQVAMQPTHKNNVKKLLDAGVEVVYWRDAQFPYMGNHEKFMIVDKIHTVAGGINFGDVYSHLGDKDSPKWRDTDLYLKGEISKGVYNRFASEWNSQVALQKLNFTKVKQIAVSKKTGNIKAAQISHRPGPNGDSNIHTFLISTFLAAKKEINISNAYVILTPGLKVALKDAINRGVRVNVHTNSSTSVDEKAISTPILDSVRDLKLMGANIYLKKGDTTHSKILEVDGEMMVVGSFNIHPRSFRMELESIFVVFNDDLSLKLRDIMYKDFKAADEVKSVDDIKVEFDILSALAMRMFFDQL